MTTFGRVHWIAALLTALALHAAIAFAVFSRQTNTGVEAPGFSGIEIGLGPAGGAPGGAASAASQKTDEADDSVETPTDVPEPVEPPEDSPPEPTPEPQPVDETPDPAPEETIAIAQTPSPAPASAPSSAPSTAGTDGRAGAADGEAGAADSDDLTAGGFTGAEADYSAVLIAWLEQHKEYPQRARARRQEDVVRLFIAIDRDGNVLDARIEESAGYPLLDRATLDMIERAAPLPPLPDDIPGDRLEIIVPVHFFLKRG